MLRYLRIASRQNGSLLVFMAILWWNSDMSPGSFLNALAPGDICPGFVGEFIEALEGHEVKRKNSRNWN